MSFTDSVQSDIVVFILSVEKVGEWAKYYRRKAPGQEKEIYWLQWQLPGWVKKGDFTHHYWPNAEDTVLNETLFSLILTTKTPTRTPKLLKQFIQ